MKLITLMSSVVVIMMLPSCDGDDNSMSHTNWENLNKEITNETDTERAEVRSFIGKNVIFIGNSLTTSITSILGTRETTITDSSFEIIENFLPDGTSLSNGSATITSIDSTIVDNIEFGGQFIEIVDSPKTYKFNLNDNSEAAILISFDENSDKYISILTYISDTSGTYEKTSDQTINGVRVLTNETGIFEILDSYSPDLLHNNILLNTNSSLDTLFD